MKEDLTNLYEMTLPPPPKKTKKNKTNNNNNNNKTTKKTNKFLPLKVCMV